MLEDPASPAFVCSVGTRIDGMPGYIRPGVTAVLFNDDGEVLLEKRSDNGFWGLPGGAVDIGESVTDAILRELMEETSLVVRVKRLIGIYSDPHEHNISAYPDGNIVHWVTSSFECEQVSGEIAISHESTDIGYFPIDALPENMVISHRVRIHDALKKSDTPFVR